MPRQAPDKPRRSAPDNGGVPERQESHETDVLFSSIGEGAIVIDANGDVAKINDVALQILRRRRADILHQWYPGTVIAENEHGEEISRIERPITEAFLTGKPVFRRMAYRRPDGTRVPVAVTVSPLLSESKPIGAIEVFRDITEEVELERAKDEFISIASHQLRTPASVVKQYLGMMLEGYMGQLNPDQRRALQIAYESNDRQINIVNDLLAVAQAASNSLSLHIRKTDISYLIGSIVQNYTETYRKKDLRLKYVQPAETIYAEVDANHIRMVIENLLDNAYKYTHAGKGVTISAETEGDVTNITVTDEGVGIAPEDIPRLFQKFSRIDNPLSFEGGTGLGLYWAKRLIDRHNGALTVSSEVGVGTTFTISVPTRQPDFMI